MSVHANPLGEYQYRFQDGQFYVVLVQGDHVERVPPSDPRPFFYANLPPKPKRQTKRTHEGQQVQQQADPALLYVGPTPLPAALVHRVRLKSVTPRIPYDPQRANQNGLQGTLLFYQHWALEEALNHPRYIWGLDCGLGKTLCTIALILYLCLTDVLIIVPSGLVRNWKDEFTKWAPHLNIHLIQESKQAVFPMEGGIHIMSLGLLHRVTAALEAHQKFFDMLVMDEAHEIKTIKSMRSKVALWLSQRAKRFLALTGTPCEQHDQAYGLLRCVDPVTFKRFFHFQKHGLSKERQPYEFHFADRFCVPKLVHLKKQQQVFDFKFNARRDELKALWCNLFCLRLRKKLLHLPPMTSQTVSIGELPPMKAKYFSKALDAMESLRKTKGQQAVNGLMTQLVLETAQLKIPFLCAYVQHVLETHSKTQFLCFYDHKIIGDALEKVCVDHDTRFVRIDGDLSSKKRLLLLEDMKNDKNIRVGLMSLRATSVGFNIAFLQLMLVAERTFFSIHHKQAESRIHRLGQTQKVTIQYLDLPGTTDSLVQRCVQRKHNTSAFLLGDDDDDDDDQEEEEEETKVAA